MEDVIRILSAMEQGNPQAAEQLLPLLYSELRILAAQMLARENLGHTLQPTSLVHEAYLRLIKKSDDPKWNGRGHFYAAIGEAMRRILVEQARRRNALKRGGNVERLDFHDLAIAAPETDDEVLALNEVLDQFEAINPVAATLVKLRFFAGHTMSEAALALDLSERTAYGIWAYARSWLHRKMRSE